MSKRRHKKSPDALEASIAEAVKQSRLAYKFTANSYTASAFVACLTAASRLRAERDKAALAITKQTKPAGLPGLSSGLKHQSMLERPETNSD